MSDSPRTIAVITGDLVNSTTLGPAGIERAMTALADCANAQGDLQQSPLRFTRHRGDGWQVVLEKPVYYLRTALAFRAALRAESSDFDTYVGIAEGKTSTRIGTDLNRETSTAFSESGTLLDSFKITTGTKARMGHASFDIRATALYLADYISQHWTSTQAQAVLYRLNRKEDVSYTQLAEALGKSRQAAAKSLNAAGYEFIEAALFSLEKGS